MDSQNKLKTSQLIWNYIVIKKEMHPGSILFILNTSKQVLCQTVQTQMKCHIRLHFISACTISVRHWKENLPTDLDVNSFQSNNLSILVLFLEIETFPPINKPKHLFVIAWTSIQIYL